MNFDRPLRWITLAVLAWVLVASPGCGSAADEDPSNSPDAATSDTGAAGAANNSVPLDQGELRLVVLSPALAVTLVDLGLEDVIVGRHGYDMVLRESVPVCGDQGGIDYERLLGVEPTHVLVEWGSRELPTRLLQLAGQHGWEVSNHQLLTLDQVATTADDLHERFVRRTAGPSFGPGGMMELPGSRPGSSEITIDSPIPEAVRTETDVPRPSRRMAAAWLEREDRPVFTGPVLLLGSTEPLGVPGPGSAHHELLVRMGATPAITEGAPWMTLDAEDLIALDPSAIVLIAPRPRDVAPGASNALAELRSAVGVYDLACVRDGRLAVIDHPYALLPSTALIDVADDLRAILEGWGR